MFSLIITIISVALVAALALATLYYGGDTFNQGRADAQAAQVLIQGQQILGAAELYYLKNGDWPDTMQDLVDGQFLQSVPTAQAPDGAMSEAQAAVRVWEVATAGVPVYVLSDVETDLCKMVNKKAFGKAGVPKKAYTALSAQCYGETPNDFTVVVTKNGSQLVDALPPDDFIIHPEKPDPRDPDRWIFPPDEPPGEEPGEEPPPADGELPQEPDPVPQNNPLLTLAKAKTNPVKTQVLVYDSGTPVGVETTVVSATPASGQNINCQVGTTILNGFWSTSCLVGSDVTLGETDLLVTTTEGSLTIPLNVVTYSPGMWPLFSLESDYYMFGTISVGQSYSRAVRVHNNGSAPIEGITVRWAPPETLLSGAFSVVSNGCSGTLLPLKSCDVVVKYEPTQKDPGGFVTQVARLILESGPVSSEVVFTATTPP